MLNVCVYMWCVCRIICLYADHSEPVFVCTYSKHMYLCTFLSGQRSLAHTLTHATQVNRNVFYTGCLSNRELCTKYMLLRWLDSALSYDTYMLAYVIVILFDCISNFLTPCTSNGSLFLSWYFYSTHIHDTPRHIHSRLSISIIAHTQVMFVQHTNCCYINITIAFVARNCCKSNAMLRHNRQEAETLILMLKKTTTTFKATHFNIVHTAREWIEPLNGWEFTNANDRKRMKWNEVHKRNMMKCNHRTQQEIKFMPGVDNQIIKE